MRQKNKSGKKPLANEKLHRFVVSSAQDAVLQIREKLGPNAEVLSVKQVKGTGFERFLSSPKLEVIAQIVPASQSSASPPQSEEAFQLPEEENPQLVSDPNNEAPQSSTPGKGAANKPALDPVKTDGKKAADSGLVASSSQVKRRSSLMERIRAQSNAEDLTCRQFLENAGLSERLMARLSSDTQWKSIGEAPLSTGMTQAVSWLKAYRKQLRDKPLSNRVAFIGGAGAGKTTALCKLLARDVFIAGKSPQVLRMEVDKPHMDEGLSMYCEVLGVPYYRSESEIDFSSAGMIYLDFPGYSLRDLKEQNRLAAGLDRLEVDSRVFVMNAAYDGSILNRYIQTAQSLGATHQILTHVDELIEAGKLWSFLLDGERQLLFLSNGQNVAGDRIDDVMGYLIERTFKG